MGLGLGLNLSGGAGVKRFTGSDYDFDSGRYAVNGPYGSSVPAGMTYSRTGAGYARTVAGTLTAFAANAPRITSKGLLVEGARTNLLWQSQDFSTANWPKTQATVTANATTAPDGTTTADKIVSNGATAAHYVAQAVTVDTSQVQTFSCFIKAAERTTAVMETTFGLKVTINLTTGGLTNAPYGSATGQVSTALQLADGWWLITLTGSETGGSSKSASMIVGMPSFAGDSVSGIYVWQADLQIGTPLSPILTAAGTATRGADTISLAVPSNCNSYIVDHDGGQATGSVTPGGSFNLGSGAWVGGYVQRVRLIP